MLKNDWKILDCIVLMIKKVLNLFLTLLTLKQKQMSKITFHDSKLEEDVNSFFPTIFKMRVTLAENFFYKYFPKDICEPLKVNF